MKKRQNRRDLKLTTLPTLVCTYNNLHISTFLIWFEYNRSANLISKLQSLIAILSIKSFSCPNFVFSMIMFKIKWDLKPLLNKNLKKFRLLRDLSLQASSNNGKRPCSNINITSNIKCYLNHVCRSKIKSGLCAACPRCPEEPFKTSHVANMWLRCTVRW